MATKEYASLTTLQTFLDNLKKLFATKTELSGKADLDALSIVAKSGSYADLSDKPTEYTDSEIQKIWDNTFV